MEATKNKGLYFTELHLNNIRCFGKDAILKLDNSEGDWSQWNIILGDNGLGKTTLLRVLLGAELDKDTSISTEFSYVLKENHVTSTKVFTDIQRKEKRISATFFYNSEYTKYEIEDFREILRGLPILAYGATRLMSQGKLGEDQSDNFDTLFRDDAKLINAEEWLLQMDYAASKDSPVRPLAELKRNKIVEILKAILPDISDIKFTTPTKQNLIPKVEFETLFGWMSIHQLSLGYRNMVSWIVDVAARMFDYYESSADPLSEPAIILVDEIDLHLHPKWQRKIFDFLTDKFPLAQFIVTAHSPLVVQSAPKDANLILLKKAIDEEGNNYVEIKNDIESVRTWRLDQIMTSDLFEFESSRGAETEKQLKRRTVLLQKSELSKDEEKELQKLNEFVYSLPTENNIEDNEAMEIIRRAADYLKNK